MDNRLILSRFQAFKEKSLWLEMLRNGVSLALFLAVVGIM
ncbi:Predicted protein [Listeria monocytogenes]|nr:Predicted protein [Listeria monocytogenes]